MTNVKSIFGRRYCVSGVLYDVAFHECVGSCALVKVVTACEQPLLLVLMGMTDVMVADGLDRRRIRCGGGGGQP